MNVIKANKHIIWSINELHKIKTDVSENKYSFQHQVALSSGQQKLMEKEVNLHYCESRSQNVSFEDKDLFKLSLTIYYRDC